MSSKNNPKSEKNIEDIGNIQQIREILFGPQSRELEKKFKKMEEDLKHSQDEIFKKMKQNQKDLNARINSEFNILSRKIKSISTQQEENLADIKTNEVKQEKRIRNSMDILSEEIHSKNDQLYKNQIQNRNSMQSDMNKLKKEIYKMIDTRLAQSCEEKLSRDEAAEIMMETAMRLKDSRSNPQAPLKKKIKK